MMFRFAIFQYALFLPFISSQNGDASFCVEISNNLTDCLFTSNVTTVTTDSTNIDVTACGTCFSNNNYNPSQASCSTATSKICGLLDKCQDSCFVKLNVCQEENDAYYECIFGISYAPTGCLVQCDGSTSDAESDANGASSSRSMSLIGSSIVLAAVMFYETAW